VAVIQWPLQTYFCHAAAAAAAAFAAGVSGRDRPQGKYLYKYCGKTLRAPLVLKESGTLGCSPPAAASTCRRRRQRRCCAAGAVPLPPPTLLQ
jgi:hypothetical protein